MIIINKIIKVLCLQLRCRSDGRKDIKIGYIEEIERIID